MTETNNNMARTTGIFNEAYKANLSPDMQARIDEAAQKDFRVGRLVAESPFAEAYKEFLASQFSGDTEWRECLDHNVDVRESLDDLGINSDVYFGGIQDTPLQVSGKEVADSLEKEHTADERIFRGLVKETKEAFADFIGTIECGFISIDQYAGTGLLQGGDIEIVKGIKWLKSDSLETFEKKLESINDVDDLRRVINSYFPDVEHYLYAVCPGFTDPIRDMVCDVMTTEEWDLRSRAEKDLKIIREEGNSFLERMVNVRDHCEDPTFHPEYHGDGTNIDQHIPSRIKPSARIEYTVQVEPKDALDVKFGNDAGCCLGIFPPKKGYEDMGKGKFVPFYQIDDATVVMGIYQKVNNQKPKRVGMVLAFATEGFDDNPYLVCNSLELSEGSLPTTKSVLEKITEHALSYVDMYSREAGFAGWFMGSHNYNTSVNFASTLAPAEHIPLIKIGVDEPEVYQEIFKFDAGGYEGNAGNMLVYDKSIGVYPDE